MNEYIVSARKYRPTTFDTVVGQNALVKTLKNAIDSGKLAHAYLFCGPRGVGKTTCARIFAKTINCEHRTADGEACNECESCQSFNEQRSYNIHELDAASNNSVDNIRELIEQVKIPPQIGRYKVFIIDEVHMLSSQAFNAFLKTLEEPPRHAIFIMATTEKQKILPTILSRCQTYDFQRISIQDIVNQLERIASKEGIKAETQALHIIARKADGGMRDALSIFDQIASFTGGNITYQATIANLGILGFELFFRLTDAAIQGNIPAALLMLDQVISKGFDPQNFIGGWASHIRDLMVSKDPATLTLVEAGPEIAQKYQEQAVKCSPQFLLYGLQIANECDFNYKNSRNKRLSVELAICRICQLMHPIAPTPAAAPPIQSIKPQPTPVVATPTPSTASQYPAAPPRQVSTPVQNSAQRQTYVPPVGTSPNRRFVSIKSMATPANTDKKASEQNESEATMNEHVGVMDVLIQWKNFAKQNAGERLLAAMMNESVVEATDDSNLNYVVKLFSNDQKDLFLVNKKRITDFIVRNVHNSNIAFSYELQEAQQHTTNLNPRERFEHIKAEYPEIISALDEQFKNLELA